MRKKMDSHGCSANVNATRGGGAAGLMYKSVIQIINGSGGQLTEQEAREREQQYLGRIREDCGSLEWLASIRYQDENTPGITLDSVYTALLSTTPKESLDREKGQTEKRSDVFSVLEVLNRESRLVLSGDPGSGKSAFVNFLALCLAGEALGDPARNLVALTEPLPDDKGKPKEEKQLWLQGALLPVRLILRDFAASSHFPADGTQGETQHLLVFIKEQLNKKGITDYYPILEARFRAGEVLVMFDGLDEVAQTGEKRERMIQCISAFAGSYQNSRLLVTCRPYAYEQERWHIKGFRHAALAHFGRGQICRFIDRWYRSRSEFDHEMAEKRAGKLKQVVLCRENLWKLIKRPLLLTLTAYLHANRHELPEQRADLYERLLELLIEKWEAARFKVDDADAARSREQHSLAEFLQVGADNIRLVLERLAFEAHANQGDLSGTADIPAEKLTHHLVCVVDSREEDNRRIDPLQIGQYLRDRVGILYQRGGENDLDAVYTFPHRTFQEYLAACYFRREEQQLFQLCPEAECDEWVELAAHLGRSDPDRWREVVLLAGGIKSTKEPGPIWNLLDSLFPRSPAGNELCRADAWGLRLAGEILAKNLKRQLLPSKRERILKRIQSALPLLLNTAYLKATERVSAGGHLAKIDDPRNEVMEVDAMQFCYLPPGPFFLGSTEEDEMAYDDERAGAGEHSLDYPCWLARYSVTVAQFRQFVDESGFTPGNSDCLKEVLTTPVVWVSWGEATAFCRWLTERWQDEGWLPEGYHATLPSESEWEKGARGGFLIPAEGSQVVQAVSVVAQRHAALKKEGQVLKQNPEIQRRYPWGEEPDSERMNFGMKVGDTSPVGAYPAGRSPYGCEEMSGNVWEWTCSRFKDYHYSEDGYFCRQHEGVGSDRCALHGGSFFSGQRNVRCAVRLDDSPGGCGDDIGFRVVLSPFL